MVNLNITQEQLEILFDLLPNAFYIEVVYGPDSDFTHSYRDLKHKIYSEVVKNENL